MVGQSYFFFLVDGRNFLFSQHAFLERISCFLSRLYFLDGLVHDGVAMSSGEPFVKPFNYEAIYGVRVFMKILFVGRTGFLFLMIGKFI